MRDRHPAAEAGRAEPFALGDGIGNQRRVERQARGGNLRQLVQQLALVARGEVDADRFEIEKLGKLHRNHFPGQAATRGQVRRAVSRADGPCHFDEGSTQPMVPSSRR